MANFAFLAAAAAEAEPTALGLNAGGWVAAAMLVVFGIMLWGRVPALVAAALDKKIAEITAQLVQAASLRREAEALRDEYTAKLAGAQHDADALLDNAKEEAAAIVASATQKTAELIARREKIAQDKIAASESAAIDELRATAARTATSAAGMLIAAQHTAKADQPLVEKAIAAI